MARYHSKARRAVLGRPEQTDEEWLKRSEELLVSHDDVPSYKHRIVVAGSRSYNNYEEFEYFLSYEMRKYDKSNSVVISGVAFNGPDAMVIDWCIENGWHYALYPAAWKEFGRSAGMIRNAQMRKIATDVIVFWDMKSPGSKEMYKSSRDAKHLYTRLFIVHPDNIPYTP